MKELIVYNKDIENKFYEPNKLKIKINKNDLEITYKTIKVCYDKPINMGFHDWYNSRFYSLEDYIKTLEYIKDKIEQTKKIYNQIKKGENNEI